MSGQAKEYLYSRMHKQSRFELCCSFGSDSDRRIHESATPDRHPRHRPHEPVRSQEQLRLHDQGAGFDVTQATLSRDIRELGLVKGGADGAYQTPGRVEPNGHNAKAMLQRALAAQLAHRSRAAAGAAADGSGARAVACALRSMARELPDVVGTLAGEDTILVITPDARRARTLVKRLEEMSQA